MKKAGDRRRGSSKQVKPLFAALLAPEDFRNTKVKLKQGLALFTEKPMEQSQAAVPTERV